MPTFALAFCLLALADDPARVIPAVEAKGHIGEICTVEMIVRLTKDVPDKACFLDSEADYKDVKNFAVVIVAQDRETFQKAGIDHPTEFYKGKRIRVTGRIILESKQVRMHVEEPERIVVVKDE